MGDDSPPFPRGHSAARALAHTFSLPILMRCPMHANLSDRQLRFVFEYLLDQNACAAAVRAGYSRHSRKSAAHSLMGNPAVLEAIRVELQGLVAEAGCSVVALVKERARGAFFRAGKM